MIQVTLSPAALSALDSLSQKDKSAVLRSIKLLENQKISTLRLNSKVQKLVGIQKFYSLRASNDIRVIFEYSKDKNINILDIIRHSTYERLFKSSNSNQVNHENI